MTTFDYDSQNADLAEDCISSEFSDVNIDIKPIICSQCNAAFEFEDGLNEHIKTHFEQTEQCNELVHKL